MKRLLWLLPVLGIGAAAWWLVAQKNAPPEVRYTVARSGVLVDTLATNGKVEPSEYASVRAERAGSLTRLSIEKGQTVQAGQIVGEITSADAASDREAAEARAAQIQAELRSLESGGRAVDLAAVEGELARIALERKQAVEELAALERLIAKNAATKQEAQILRDRVANLDAQRKAAELRRRSLFTPADRTVLEQRLREARTAIDAARRRQEQSVLRAPIRGLIYQLDVRAGAFLNPGDLVCHIGKVDRLVVKVFVDEPELGRVAPGMAASITWDALPGKEWQGSVEKMPVQIVAQGTRQVGEVIVQIDNADLTLPPGANINAAIRSRSVANAVIVPKESLRRDSDGKQGVFSVAGDIVRWRPVKLGVTNVTHAQIVEGVADGDRVLLATDEALRDGSSVRAVPEN